MSINLIKEDGFPLKKTRSKQYPTETMTDEDYPDDYALFANAPTQTKSQLHSLGQTAGGIILYMKADKTEFIHVF